VWQGSSSQLPLSLALHQVFSLARRCGTLTWHKASEHHIPEAWRHEAQAIQSKSNTIVSAFMPDWKLENAVGNRGRERKYDDDDDATYDFNCGGGEGWLRIHLPSMKKVS
jgi:hypothetical protein